MLWAADWLWRNSQAEKSKEKRQTKRKEKIVA
jgi:hypothetical protein